ncbi:hypothetical protein [Candidatus Nanohalobium constans]|uniref:Uncharacterized protein n=1 Tax=Candidatus Nanohalobium constans TaxID=2565781 RepID=A0A5Q0UIB6_9ARCH|nr:hypothetical protein [Candidatus Nanohalobium constans]QGA80619.1 hypothetical protein LC1Nh_0732 [Candidatus Nanohalobium constans]
MPSEDKELHRKISSQLLSWGYTESEVDYVSEELNDIIDFDKMIDFLILNGSESEPQKYDEDALDLHVLLDDYILVLEYSGGRMIDYIYYKYENVGRIRINKNDQRLHGAITLDIATGYEIGLGSYEDEKYSEIKNYIKTLRGMLNE